jgi:hypothetical protein
MTKFMYKNEFFQSLGMKNKLFKVQGRKMKLMYSLEMKTIFWPLFFIGYIFRIFFFFFWGGWGGGGGGLLKTIEMLSL